MHEAVAALIDRRRPADVRMWRSFWDLLDGSRLDGGEAVALLASLSASVPDHAALTAFFRSLEERRPRAAVRFPGAVNIVGTGGGPETFNISTAAAFTAAAMGIPVIKTGSRAYSGRVGSLDLLRMLGIPLTTSYEEIEATLASDGIAFAGYFVYPRELTLLARQVFPLSLRSLGRFVNCLGPFLAEMPVSAQVVGVSDQSLLPSLQHIAGQARRAVWLCVNDLGVDELVSFARNAVHANDGSAAIRLTGSELGLAPGMIDDIRRPEGEQASVAEHFLAVLSGRGGRIATQTVCLNAAALAVASGRIGTWADAIAAAAESLRSGAVLQLASRLRASRPSQAFMAACPIGAAGG
jgi:anthranilate phosphoribosyltransferase